MSDEDLVWFGAAELGRLIAAGEVTSRQATIAYLDRIAALNPALEAYVTVTADRALTEAAARDTELANGHRRGPLHGVPYCLKDVIATGGIRTTAGSTILADWVPDADATVAARLAAAGAVLLGKVNTHEFAFGVTTQNAHARTRNPWDRERIAGGSSGGSGAALAAGLAAFSIGTDTAGSIRLPAAFCGIAGIKPTFGLVSAAGVVAQSYTSDHVGPMARTIEDLAVVLDVVAGHDPEDPHSLPNAPTDNAATLKQGVKGLRIGVPRELMVQPLQAAVAGAFEAAKEAFRELGADVREISVPLLAHASTINNAIVPPETAAQHLHWAETWFKARVIRYGEDVAALLATGRAVTATGFIHASRERKALAATLAELFATEVDLLLTPTVAVAATHPTQKTLDLGRREFDPLDVMIHFLCGFSLAGVPALAVPAGFDPNGMPLSIQIVGRRLDDARVLAAGRAFEGARPWSGFRPASV
ncbi:Asp-tRNA(Asn)/Glu-tRNA(Gln) amidotransferase subunit GatA [Vineibacter terrae]|uniref:Indoleacetamide hydrolase n=1 Tax=Vineibacter terrae TaxID=2586908 RepID=A0A5C8PS24_9HYPH|nr:amidase [Vineibacter terrae]TXL78793.1 Asp-tRNA(Asn)/Glu-tRNA(Gln) amidotransferase subunit GatA [Vineibacter terrae]